MKNHRGKRRSKKSKTSPRHEDEGMKVDEVLAKEDMAADEGQIGKSAFTFSSDHYSLYERISGIEDRRKVSQHFYVTGKNRRTNAELETKGQPLLPQLKESKHHYSTFVGGNRATRHLLNGSSPSDQTQLDVLRPTCFADNRSSKKLASVSFVGAYDLADMRPRNKTARKQKPSPHSVLKSNNCGEETKRDIKSPVTFWVERKRNDEKKSEKCFPEYGAGKTTYAVKNLTLERNRPSSSGIEAHENVSLPGIDKKSSPKKCYKKPPGEGATQEKLSRKLENGTRASRTWSKLPRLNGNQSKQTRTSRRKRCKHDMAYEAVYVDKILLRLPLLTHRTSDFF